MNRDAALVKARESIGPSVHLRTYTGATDPCAVGLIDKHGWHELARAATWEQALKAAKKAAKHK